MKKCMYLILLLAVLAAGCATHAGNGGTSREDSRQYGIDDHGSSGVVETPAGPVYDHRPSIYRNR